MSQNFSFRYALPGDQELVVECSVVKGRRGRMPDMNGPGEPPEDDDITIESIGLIVEVGDGFWPEFNIDGLFIRTGTAPVNANNKVPAKYVSLEEAILDAAHDAWADAEAAA